MPSLPFSPARAFSLFADAAFSLYIAALMIYPIGYGTERYGPFVWWFTAEEGWRVVTELAEEGDMEKRLVMSILTNFRMHQSCSMVCCWDGQPVWLLCRLREKRATVHLLGFLINANTGLLHLYHMGMFGDRWDEHLVPKDDPYHRIPIVSDWTVSVLNLIAFLLIGKRSEKVEKRSKYTFEVSIFFWVSTASSSPESP